MKKSRQPTAFFVLKTGEQFCPETQIVLSLSNMTVYKLLFYADLCTYFKNIIYNAWKWLKITIFANLNVKQVLTNFKS